MQKATDRKPRTHPKCPAQAATGLWGLQKRRLGEGSRGSHVDQHPFHVPLAPSSASQCLSFPICERAPPAIAAISTNTGASVAGQVTPSPPQSKP